MALTRTAVIVGDKFSEKYVTLMRNTIPGIVIVGDKDYCDRQVLNNWQGWWSKLELFAPWNEDLRPLINFDLDTYILDPTVLAEFDDLIDDELWLLADFNRPQHGESGIMIAPKDADDIYSGAATAVADRTIYGDGKYLSRFYHGKLQKNIAGIKSYKVDQLYDDPKNARIVCFHGKPKPHETTGWAHEFWNTKT